MPPHLFTSRLSVIFPGIVVLVGFFLTFSFWFFMDAAREDTARERLQSQAEYLSQLIEGDLNLRLPSINRIVSRWQVRHGLSREEFVSDAANYIKDEPGYQAIEWVDRNYQVKWVVPLKGNERAVGLNLGFEEKRRLALEEAKQKNGISITPPIELVQGGKGFIGYFPIFVDSKFDGFVLVVFKIEDWLKHVFSGRLLSDIAAQESIKIEFSEQTIFKSTGFDTAEHQNYTTSHRVFVYDKAFDITLRPNDAFFEISGQKLPEIVAGLVLTLSLSLGALIYFLQKSYLLNQKYLDANQTLSSQSHEREKAEIKANDANKAKSRFLAAMSHEIRTPLNGVMGVLQLIDDRDVTENVREKLKIARDSSFYLVSLVNQILDFARIESGTMERIVEEFNVSNLLDDLYGMFKTQASEKDIGFDYKIIGEEVGCYEGDVVHLRQVLFNLIGNAIKFTAKGHVQVLVSIQGDDSNISQLSFEISDTGYGIAPNEIQGIFDEFRQSEAGRNTGGGTGLGLSISKRLVDLMDGTISVDSNVGRGTVFSVSVPVKSIEDTKVEPEQAEENIVVQPMCILVAEDNPVNHIVIGEMLEKDGHSVTIAKDGGEAVEIFKANPEKFDLVLMDIQMPVLTGIEATEAIREITPDTRNLPIIALTANAFKSQVDGYLAAGMQAALTKPIIHSDLRKALSEFSTGSKKKINDETEAASNDKIVTLPNIEKGSVMNNVSDGSSDPILDIPTLSPLVRLMSQEQFESLLDALNSTLSRTIPELSKDSLEFERGVSLAHDIKGMAANVGLVRLSNFSATIEENCKAGTECLELRKSLHAVAEESLEELAMFLQQQGYTNNPDYFTLRIDRTA